MQEKINQKVEEYIEFIQMASAKVKEHNQLIKDGILDPNKLNYLLAEHGNILNALINEQERYLIQAEENEELFDKWFDKKYLEIRDKINKDRSSSKVATKEEIRIQVRVEYEENYYSLYEPIKDFKRKERYYSKLIKQWESQVYTLRNSFY